MSRQHSKWLFLFPDLVRSVAVAYDAAALNVLQFVQLARCLGAADVVQVGIFLQGYLPVAFDCRRLSD